MQFRECKIEFDKSIEDEVFSFLESLHTLGYFEILFDGERKKKESEVFQATTQVVVYFSLDDLQKEIELILFIQSISNALEFYHESRVIETREFENAYKEFYKPFCIGGLWIVPLWEKQDPQWKDKKVLFLNPGMAFGTGHHETTKLLLERITELPWEKKSILDVGTGSGILSGAVAVSGASKILAIDIDPNSIKAISENFKENVFPSLEEIQLEEGGFDQPKAHAQDFDFLFANITFGVLSRNILEISNLKAKEFLFSGIITERKSEFLELLRIHIPGASLWEKTFNGWEAIHWKRT